MTEAENNSMLEARGIGRREPNGNQWLLRDIDINIDGGIRLAIVGPTGSGKTLLMRALAHLDSIDAGEILWQGSPIHGDSIPRFRRRVIYLHQRPALIEGTVEENLQLPFTLRAHHGSTFSLETTLPLLRQVGRNGDFLKRSTGDLSGGEAQIVALLRAIQLQPTLLLLDEPTAALDDGSMQMIEQLVTNWFEEARHERAYLWVSHNREQVSRVADHVMVISGGRLSNGSNGIQEPLT